MFRFLFHTNQSKFLYITKAYLLHMAITAPLLMVVFFLLKPDETPNISSPFLFVVFIGPAIETLIMAPILKLLFFCNLRIVATATLSALIWAGFHSVFVPIWGLGVFIHFFVLSISYITWRKQSFKAAFLVTFSIHALNNAVAMYI